MKKQILLAVGCLSLCALNGCSSSSSTLSKVAVGEMSEWSAPLTVDYYWNYGVSTTFSSDDYSASTSQLIYKQEEIVTTALLSKPTDPVRTNYDFKGWYTDSDCETLWNFASDYPTGNTFLYAGWEQTGEGEGYVEPAYVETIETDDTLTSNLKVTGILNVAITNGSCSLPKASMKRLSSHESDASFALNYKKKTGTELETVTYNKTTGVLTVISKNGNNEETQTIQIYASSTDLSLSDATQEGKAEAFEEGADAYSNHHILLAGSSSLEFWSDYSEALSPIVTYNHGIGGTTAKQWKEQLLERLVLPLSPKAVVYYVGINDLVNSGGTVASITSDIEGLMDSTHEKLPSAHLFFIYINILPGYYLGYTDSIKAINSNIKSYMNDKDYLTGIAAGDSLLKSDGTADAGYFRLDNLHMSSYGYVVWGKVVKKALEDWMG